MRIEELESLSSKDRDMFKLICNKLLTQTFDLIKDYLLYLDWELHKEANYGYYFVTNLEGTNRHIFSQDATKILLILRIFELNSLAVNSIGS